MTEKADEVKVERKLGDGASAFELRGDQRSMRPVMQDVIDEAETLEPKGRWTTSVVYWQDGTMQLQTQHGIVGSKPHMTIYVRTHGPISDETIRVHLLKMRGRRFSFERGSMFPVVMLGWLRKIQAWAIRYSLVDDGETGVLDALEDLIKAHQAKSLSGDP